MKEEAASEMQLGGMRCVTPGSRAYVPEKCSDRIWKRILHSQTKPSKAASRREWASMFMGAIHFHCLKMHKHSIFIVPYNAFEAIIDILDQTIKEIALRDLSKDNCYCDLVGNIRGAVLPCRRGATLSDF